MPALYFDFVVFSSEDGDFVVGCCTNGAFSATFASDA
jgi:hypothetical protein